MIPNIEPEFYDVDWMTVRYMHGDTFEYFDWRNARNDSFHYSNGRVKMRAYREVKRLYSEYLEDAKNIEQTY